MDKMTYYYLHILFGGYVDDCTRLWCIELTPSWRSSGVV